MAARFLVAVLLSAAPLLAQQSPRPSHRMLPATAARPSDGRLLLFGGMAADMATALDDTWEWDGGRWRLLTPAVHPAGRAGAALAWDAARERFVLYGGVGDAGVGWLDTWEWDGRAWRLVDSAGAPGMRTWHAMFYDPTRRQVMLVGGVSPEADLPSDDIWAWNGITWSVVQPATDYAGVTPMERSRMRAYSAATRSDLRNLVTAQEVYFADHSRYTTALDSLSFSASQGVTVRIVSASATGWAAVATHANVPGGRCGIRVGDVPPPFAAVTEEGFPVCEGFDP